MASKPSKFASSTPQTSPLRFAPSIFLSWAGIDPGNRTALSRVIKTSPSLYICRIIFSVIIKAMTEIHKLLKDYLDYLSIEKNRSPRTRSNYERYLKRFIDSGKIENIKDITEEKIREFRVSLAGQTPAVKKSTQSYYVIVLRNFLKYLAKRDYKTVSPDKIELPKIPQRQIQIMDSGDLDRLLSFEPKDTLRSLRDKAILETLFSTGLRVSELCSLDRYLNLDRGEITIRGKGDKLRVVFISPEAKAVIKKYLEKRFDTEPAMFIGLTKSSNPKPTGRMTTRTVERLIAYYAKLAGIPKKVTPHTLRHQFATDLLINGADLRSVQELLGHSNISTTQIYTHLTNKELKEVHAAFHSKRRK